MTPTQRKLLLSLLVLLLAAACSSAPATAPPPTRTTIPTYNYVSPTPVAQVATAVATLAAQTGIDPQAIEAGRGRYVALECGSCHGENAEGGEAVLLVGTTLSQDDFITYLRNGGEIGVDHQYQSNRLSDRGAVNLYLYLQSLSS